VDLARLDHAFGVDDEGAAQREAFLFDHHAEVAGDLAGRVADQRVLDLLDRVRRVVPRLVGEVRVGRDAVHLDAEVLELAVLVGQVLELGRAHEGEVGRVEDEHAPLALERLLGELDELAGVVGGGLERLDLGVDEGHAGSVALINKLNRSNGMHCPPQSAVVDSNVPMAFIGTFNGRGPSTRQVVGTSDFFQVLSGL
jgi:hypothetical protein